MREKLPFNGTKMLLIRGKMLNDTDLWSISVNIAAVKSQQFWVKAQSFPSKIIFSTKTQACRHLPIGSSSPVDPITVSLETKIV